MRSHKFEVSTLAVVLCLVGCSSGGSSGEQPTASGGSGSSVPGGSSGGVGASSAGTASAGMAPTPPPAVACGAEMCEPIAVGAGFIPPCCVDPAQGTCGADVSASDPTTGCQPLHQPGALDPSCPSSAGAMAGGFPLPEFPGCCRETGQCGFAVDDLGGALPFDPGCVDATTIVPTAMPQACGTGGQPPITPTAGAAGTAGTAGSLGLGGDASGGAGGAP